MIDKLPWNFEACSPEGTLDAGHMPWGHAVHGRREGGRLVTCYGHTPPLADYDARQRAQEFDAREVLGMPQVSAGMVYQMVNGAMTFVRYEDI